MRPCTGCGDDTTPRKKYMFSRCPECYHSRHKVRQKRYREKRLADRRNGGYVRKVRRVAPGEWVEPETRNAIAAGYDGPPCVACGTPTNRGACLNCGIFNAGRAA